MDAPHLNQPPRRRPALPPAQTRLDRPTILMVTVATHARASLLANPIAWRALVDSWTRATSWQVGYYLIMPDHLHLFCAPSQGRRESVPAWCRYWKRLAGQTEPSLQGAFQDDCWNLQMRHQDHYRETCAYVERNPVRASLVVTTADWEYQGILADLIW